MIKDQINEDHLFQKKLFNNYNLKTKYQTIIILIRGHKFVFQFNFDVISYLFKLKKIVEIEI